MEERNVPKINSALSTYMRCQSLNLSDILVRKVKQSTDRQNEITSKSHQYPQRRRTDSPLSGHSTRFKDVKRLTAPGPLKQAKRPVRFKSITREKRERVENSLAKLDVAATTLFRSLTV
jgi:hypothetical protein